MSLDHDSKPALAAKLASRLFAEEDPTVIQRILGEEGCYAVSQPEQDHGSKTHPATQRIGIWESCEENGEISFVRRDQWDAWGLWARRERIPYKSSRTRVVLLGESVARGFFYDPHFNCAAVLQEILTQTFGDEAEVVDLAQTGASYSQLLETAEAARVLRPDAFVMFAGNNWLIPNDVCLNDLAAILRSGGGWCDVQSFLWEQVRASAREFSCFLGRISKEDGIPVVFVIPEFNVDWRSSRAWEAPILSYEERHKWRSLLYKANAALDRADFQLASLLAQEMVRIDEGACPVSLEIEAEAERALGHSEQARLLMDVACNSGLCLPLPRKDRCSPVLRDVLREQLPLHGVAVADFPLVCREFLGDAFPDSRIFLDYCHLTSQGIRLAMACAAETLLPKMGKNVQPWSALVDSPITVHEKVEAQARFSAAIMAALCGQKEDVSCGYLNEAAVLDPETRDLWLLIAEVHVRRMPTLFCDAFERLLAFRNSFPAIERLALGSPAREKEPEFRLINAIRKAASSKRPEAADIIGGMLVREYGIQEGGVELAQPAYCESSASLGDCEWSESCAYFRSLQHESCFRLFCAYPTPIKLALTYRTPTDVDTGVLDILVNGHEIHSLPPTPAWRTEVFEIPVKLVSHGLNIVAIRWPEPTRSREQQTAFIASHLKTNCEERHSWYSLPEIYPAYGEVFSFAAFLLPVVELRADDPNRSFPACAVT